MLSYISAMIRTFDFFGRSSRMEYWMFQLFLALEIFLAFWYGLYTGNHSLGENLCVAIGIVHVLPEISVQVRRLHDIDFSGWWYFIQFVPMVGHLILLILNCMPSTDGTNDYGPDPRELAPLRKAPARAPRKAPPNPQSQARLHRIRDY